MYRPMWIWYHLPGAPGLDFETWESMKVPVRKYYS